MYALRERHTTVSLERRKLRRRKLCDARHVRISPIVPRPPPPRLANLLRQRVVSALAVGRADEERHRVVHVRVVDLDRDVAAKTSSGISKCGVPTKVPVQSPNLSTSSPSRTTVSSH